MSISLDRKNLERLDNDSLSTEKSRSEVVRTALNEFYAKRESEKVEKSEKTKEE